MEIEINGCDVLIENIEDIKAFRKKFKSNIKALKRELEYNQKQLEKIENYLEQMKIIEKVFEIGF